MKKKFVVTFGLCGLGIALVLAAVRLYMFCSDPLSDALNEGWFDIFTLILWPGAFYLGVLQAAEPAKEIFFVCGVAVLFNGVIYAAVGWLVWRFARFMELVKPESSQL